MHLQSPWRHNLSPCHGILLTFVSPEVRTMIHIDIPLNPPKRLSIHPWRSKTPYYWESSEGQTRLHTSKYLQCPGISLLHLSDEELQSLHEGITVPVLALVARLQHHTYGILQACATIPAALQLAESAPFLLLLAVRHATLSHYTQADLEQLLALKRRDILQTLGYPSSKSVTRLISRIRLRRELAGMDMLAIRNIVEVESIVEALRHHPVVTPEHLCFLAEYHGPVWPGLLQAIDPLKHSELEPLKRAVEDILRMTQGNTRPIRHLNTSTAIHNLHDRLVERLNEGPAQQRNHFRSPPSADALQTRWGDYPPPPVPEQGVVQALKSWADLLDEGREMRHCVASYAEDIGRRQYFVYRMHRPERLTIGVKKRQNGTWVIDQVRGMRNLAPGTMAQDVINMFPGT